MGWASGGALWTLASFQPTCCPVGSGELCRGMERVCLRLGLCLGPRAALTVLAFALMSAQGSKESFALVETPHLVSTAL